MHTACPSVQVSPGNGTELKWSGVVEIITKDGHLPAWAGWSACALACRRDERQRRLRQKWKGAESSGSGS